MSWGYAQMLITSQAWVEGKHQRDTTGYMAYVWTFPFGSRAAHLGGWSKWGKAAEHGAWSKQAYNAWKSWSWWGFFLLFIIIIIIAVPFHGKMICARLGKPAVAGASPVGDNHVLITGFIASCHTSRLTNPSVVVKYAPVMSYEDANDAISNNSWSHHCRNPSASGSQCSTSPHSTKPCSSTSPSTRICPPG